jgi:hypothetical protein
VSAWIVGMPAFGFPFHIIKEAYSLRVLQFLEQSREYNALAVRPWPLSIDSFLYLI